MSWSIRYDASQSTGVFNFAVKLCAYTLQDLNQENYTAIAYCKSKDICNFSSVTFETLLCSDNFKIGTLETEFTDEIDIETVFKAQFGSSDSVGGISALYMCL